MEVPTLIMVGSEDHQMPVTLSEKMHATLPNSRLEVFDESGHFMMVEDPERFHRVLDDFLIEIGH